MIDISKNLVYLIFDSFDLYNANKFVINNLLLIIIFD